MTAYFRPLLAAIIFMLTIPQLGFGQGKIAGKVTDLANGDALIGVNVIIDGTTQGTVTDIDGNYVILNVRPGDYTLLFSYVGFQSQRISGIRVSTGQTTRYNIEMREQVIEGQEVIIQAERPLVQKDLTASKKTVVAAEIDALPVEGFFGVLVTQAGVSQGPGGTIHIRGGRSNEVSYLVDGLSVGNPFDTNGLATSVSQDAIQEMTVISGAFNAEYGRAMSGIVNLVTKEGGDSYTGNVSFYGGDTFTTHSDVFFTPSGTRLNDYTMQASLSGPLPFYKKLRFYISGRNDVDDGHIWGIRQHAPSDSANFNEDPWYYEISGVPVSQITDSTALPNEVVPMNDRTSNNIITKLSVRPFKGTKVEYSYIRDFSRRQSYSFAYRYNPDGVVSVRDRNHNHSLHWTHTLNQKSFYTLKLSYQNSNFSSYLYEDPLDPRYVSTGAIVGFPGTNFLFGGNQKGHVYESAQTLRVKLDMTRQIGAIHETKFGVELARHYLSRENFVVLFDGDQYLAPTVPDVGTPTHDKYGCRVFVEIPGQDNSACKRQSSTELSAFAQDKLEFEDFIINVGLRYELFDPNGQYIPDLLDPKGELENATIKQLVMPRIGVSFPITNAGIIHFSYGHFAQMPELRRMYTNPEFEFPAGAAPLFGNTNMRPERSVQYEIGLQQQIGSEMAFDISGFFKDIRDYRALQNIRFSTVSGEDQFSIYLNKDYANVKGVTFALTKRRPRNGYLSANIDYTYQVAEGNNDDSNAFFFNFLSGRENEFELVPLDYDQRHIISSTVTLSDPGNWSASFIGQYSTGYPYTPLLLDQKIDQLPNSGRKPSQMKLDAHIFKTFNVRGLDLRAFAKVFNLLDRLNERFVFDDTGRATYSLAGSRGIHAAWEPFYGQPGISTLDEYNVRPHWYSAPREISIGATISF
ncbi:MAG: TonB-dependent receptor plug domain-containing protein [Rhodothermales bacterium]|nr:TonB-dependent receptor plug domain-containing protein [Rhodothermales bacterium]